RVFGSARTRQWRSSRSRGPGRVESEAPEPYQAQANGRSRPRVGRGNKPSRGGHCPLRNCTAEFRQCRREPAPVAGTRPAQSKPCPPADGMGRILPRIIELRLRPSQNDFLRDLCLTSVSFVVTSSTELTAKSAEKPRLRTRTRSSVISPSYLRLCDIQGGQVASNCRRPQISRPAA